MDKIIQFCFTHTRTIITTLLFVILAGLSAYVSIPKESNPDVKIPVMYVLMSLDGISPEDAENQMLRPVEQKLKSIEGLKEIRGSSFEGGTTVTLEFDAGFNSEKAKTAVKDKIDEAKPDFPKDMRDPTIIEINLSLFPVLIVKLSGELPERTLYAVAKDLKDKIEGHVKTVLSVDIRGDRKEIVEITVHPAKLENYNLSPLDIYNFVRGNNVMVSAGNLETSTGRYPIKIPGLIQKIEDLYELPIAVNNDSVLQFKDVSEARRTFEDPLFFSRDRGVNTVSLQIVKRSGENIIETIKQVKEVVEEQQKIWPSHLNVSYSQDQSPRIKEMLTELQNNVIAAILLVMMVIIASMGLRPALLIGISVPGAFLAGILAISLLGYTLNIIVLFSLILSIGMLVDGAIIVVEYADRKMIEGLDRFEAYKQASIRMLWPVVTSILTILVVFLPLLYWPGIVGQFMKFLPITLIATLSASLLMALIFVPTLGSLFAKVSHSKDHPTYQAILKMETGDLNEIKGLTGIYLSLLQKALDHPKRILLGAVSILIFVVILFKNFGKGVEFFPSLEPTQAIIQIHARGNLSIYEKDALVKKVENKILNMTEITSIDSSTYAIPQKGKEDIIGQIYIEFADWQKRRKANLIMDEIRERTATLPGLIIDVEQQKNGPVQGKPIELSISSLDPDILDENVEKIVGVFKNTKGLKDIEDNRFIPGIQWNINVNKTQAAKFGLDVQSVGSMVKMLTNGIKLGIYRPEDSRDELDIILRFPKEYRTFEELSALKIPTKNGFVPITSMIDYGPKPKVGIINHTAGNRSLTIKADLETGVLLNNLLPQIKSDLGKAHLSPFIKIEFKGQEKDQQENMVFLGKAFMIAIFIIAIILITQFNSFFSAGLILSAVLMSTVGILIGLMIHRMPFGIVMGGLGVISLAGIIVSNNIILIDTFDHLKLKHTNVREAILRTCAQRLRPVILTKLTIILGLLPIMFAVDLNFLDRHISIGAPSTQWWIQLSTCIVYGVLFASLLTLFVTPCALMLKEGRKKQCL